MAERKDRVSLNHAIKRAGGSFDKVLEAMKAGKLRGWRTSDGQPITPESLAGWISLDAAASRAGSKDNLLTALRAGTVRSRFLTQRPIFKKGKPAGVELGGIICSEKDIDAVFPKH